MAIVSSKKRSQDEDDVEAPPPPDGGWGWMVVFGSFMIHVITDGVTYSFGVFYNEYLNYFEEGKAATSWINSILVGVTLCSGPISSAFVNRWGCRPVTIAGTILAFFGLLLSCWAKNVATLYLTVGIAAGIGFGLIYLPAIVSVTTYFEKKRSLATGIAVCGSGFGTFILAPLIARMVQEYGWRGAMMILSAVVLECIIFGAMFRPLENEIVEEEENEEVAVPLKSTNGNLDLHVSDERLPVVLVSNGDTHIQRPHSMGHFSMPRGIKLEQNGNVPNDNQKVSEISRLALSQPLLITSTQSEPRYRHHYGSQNLRRPGILYKRDIFYQGSLMNIPSYRSRLDLKHENVELMERSQSPFGYRRPSESDVEETTICGYVPCSQETKDTLREMLDFSLFKDVIFVLFTLSNFLTSIGFYIPYVYIVSKAETMGLTSEQGSLLLSIIGIANTLGRIVLGFFSDKTWVNRLAIYNWCLTICGISTVLSAFCKDFLSLAIYVSVFGFTIGAYVGLTSVILVDLLGLDKLTNAFGLLLLFQGIASLVGPPIAGVMFDALQSYDPGFYLSGITIALSGIILFTIPAIQRYQENKLRRPSVTVNI